MNHLIELYLLNKWSQIQFECILIDQIALSDCNNACIFLEWFQLACEFDLFHLSNHIRSINSTFIRFLNGLTRWSIDSQREFLFYFTNFPICVQIKIIFGKYIVNICTVQSCGDSTFIKWD